MVAGFDPDPASFDHVVTQRYLDILKSATDGAGRKLEVVVLEAPGCILEIYANDSFAAGYISFYFYNGAVTVPQFGDPRTDEKAKTKLQRLFPDREIIQLKIDGIAAGGGGIHCTTQQEPKV